MADGVSLEQIAKFVLNPCSCKPSNAFRLFFLGKYIHQLQEVKQLNALTGEDETIICFCNFKSILSVKSKKDSKPILKPLPTRLMNSHEISLLLEEEEREFFVDLLHPSRAQGSITSQVISELIVDFQKTHHHFLKQSLVYTITDIELLLEVHAKKLKKNSYHELTKDEIAKAILFSRWQRIRELQKSVPDISKLRNIWDRKANQVQFYSTLHTKNSMYTTMSPFKEDVFLKNKLFSTNENRVLDLDSRKRGSTTQELEVLTNISLSKIPEYYSVYPTGNFTTMNSTQQFRQTQKTQLLTESSKVQSFDPYCCIRRTGRGDYVKSRNTQVQHLSGIDSRNEHLPTSTDDVFLVPPNF